MEVGDYIRTKFGKIGKITSFDKCICLDFGYADPGDAREEKIVYVDTNYNFDDENDSYLVQDITKIAHDLIDLIEVGDYVNGSKVTEIKEGKPYHEDFNDPYFSFYFEDIKSVVTKEQFELMEYRVNE